MFRNVKFDTEDDFKAVLYKNFREALCEIPNKYIEEIQYKLEDVSVLTMKIPNILEHDNVTKHNPLYDRIKPKRYIVINDEERFVIKDIKIECDKDIRKKVVTANSFEYDLYKKDVTVPDGTFQLYKDKNDTVNINEGVLNWLEKEHKWKIGYIDPKAKNTNGMFDETIDTELYKDLKIKNVDKGTVLYSKAVNIDIGDNVLEFSIKYSNITSTDNKSNFTKTETDIEHKFDNFSQPIVNIKATYDLDDNYNDIIKYEFTLKDGYIQKQIQDFTYLRNLDVTFGDIVLTYKTGKQVQKEKIKYRTFEKGTHQWLSFLRDNVSEAFDCLFEFDTINKIINVYDKTSYGQDNGFYLYYQQYMTSVEKELRVDEVITRLVVSGKDGKSIEDVNPLGTNYVENFTYLIKQGNLSSELKSALLRYGKYVESISNNWKDCKTEKDKYNKQSLYLESQLIVLQGKQKAQNALKVAYMKSGESISKLEKANFLNVLKTLVDIESQINNIMQQLNDLKNKIKELDSKMIDCNNVIRKENAKDENGIIFTEDDLNELDECVYTADMEDDYYTDSTELYNNSLMILEERNKIPINFKANVVGITQHPRGWKNIIKLGNIAHIIYENNKEDVEDGTVRVIGFKYTPPKLGTFGHVKDIEFTNQLHKLHDLTTIRNVSRKSEYSKMSVDFWKGTWVDSTISNKTLKVMEKKGIDTSVFAIKGKMNDGQIDINNTGIWGTDKSDGTKDNQFYIGDSFMAVTNDSWKSCRTISDEKGLVAKSIFGTAIVGERMNLSNPDNSFKIDKNGISVYNNNKKLKARLGFYETSEGIKASFLLFNDEGKLIFSGDGMATIDTFNKVDNLDKNHPMKLYAFIPNIVKEIRQAMLFIHLDKYRSSFEGVKESGEKTIITSLENDGEDYIDFDNSHEDNDYLNDNIEEFSSNKRKDITTEIYESNMHNHLVVTKNHTHEPIYNIVETTLPSNIEILVNGNSIAKKINEDTMIDINKYLNINKLNTIEIRTETNGRIDASLTLNEFVSL